MAPLQTPLFRINTVSHIFDRMVADMEHSEPKAAIQEPETTTTTLGKKPRMSKAERKERRANAPVNIPAKPNLVVSVPLKVEQR